VFGSDLEIITMSSREIGLRAYQEWKNFSYFFPSFYLGGEYSTLSLTFSNATLASSVFLGFLGVSF